MQEHAKKRYFYVATAQLIHLLVTITLIEMMIAIGLGVTIADLATAARNRRLLIRALVANYLGVPAAAAALLLLFEAHPMVAAGFLIMAICPGAPYGPPLTAIAKGDVPIAIGLMVFLAGSSAIIAPITLSGLLSVVSGSDPLLIDVSRIAITLLFTQFLPLCLGVAVRQWWPTVAETMQKPANMASKFLNLLTISLIFVAQIGMLAQIRPRGFVGMVALLLASWTAGWLLGGPIPEIRKALAVTTSLRNFGVGLVIVTSTFPGTPAVSSVVAYGLISLLGTIALAILAAHRE